MADSNSGNMSCDKTKQKQPVVKKKPSLQSLTHKLKAEALRRFQLSDIEEETASSGRDSKIDFDEIETPRNSTSTEQVQSAGIVDGKDLGCKELLSVREVEDEENEVTNAEDFEENNNYVNIVNKNEAELEPNQSGNGIKSSDTDFVADSYSRSGHLASSNFMENQENRQEMPSPEHEGNVGTVDSVNTQPETAALTKTNTTQQYTADQNSEQSSETAVADSHESSGEHIDQPSHDPEPVSSDSTGNIVQDVGDSQGHKDVQPAKTLAGEGDSNLESSEKGEPHDDVVVATVSDVNNVTHHNEEQSQETSETDDGTMNSQSGNPNVQDEQSNNLQQAPLSHQPNKQQSDTAKDGNEEDLKQFSNTDENKKTHEQSSTKEGQSDIVDNGAAIGHKDDNGENKQFKNTDYANTQKQMSISKDGLSDTVDNDAAAIGHKDGNEEDKQFKNTDYANTQKQMSISKDGLSDTVDNDAAAIGHKDGNGEDKQLKNTDYANTQKQMSISKDGLSDTVDDDAATKGHEDGNGEDITISQEQSIPKDRQSDTVACNEPLRQEEKEQLADVLAADNNLGGEPQHSTTQDDKDGRIISDQGPDDEPNDQSVEDVAENDVLSHAGRKPDITQSGVSLSDGAAVKQQRSQISDLGEDSEVKGVDNLQNVTESTGVTQVSTSEEKASMSSPLEDADGNAVMDDESAVLNDGGVAPNNDGGGQDGQDDTTLADDFYYDKETSLFNPEFTEGVPRDLLSLHHSFGYECTKRENLHILDTNTLLFSCGNLVEILDLASMGHTYIGGTNSGGIGAITVHPSRKYFAVAEKGDKPAINIYEYPSLKLFRVLREGTLEAYAHLNFSPSGTKLASLGSSPDFMLTLWDWRNEKVILRSKAFSQDVYKVVFSPENEGHLCTSGSGHIRFWTMATTFTGLKLQGELGRFGTTELTDIEGFAELPDGKVLSGSEWGNMLLWDGGLIKVEICKKDNKYCHNGMIEQFFMDEGELMTIGADGYIKVWDFEGIDNADITDEQNRVFEMEPMYEIRVGTDVKLKSMVKSVNLNTPTIWYGQDASGAIWKLDLSFTHTSHSPELLFSYHAGSITCVEASPMSPLVATCGADCSIRLYDYVNKIPLCMAKYSAPATSLLWLPKTVDAKCTSILCGFSDGVVRSLSVARDESSVSRSKTNKSNLEFQLIQVFKPHTKSVTCIVIDKSGKTLATGSEDCSVFFFTVQDTYKPLGFIETASPVVSISWVDNAPDPGRVLVFCKDGAVLDVEVPKSIETDKTYRIPRQDLVKREYMFTRVKDKLLKAEEDERKAKIKEEKQKRKEEERKRRRARGIEEDEEEEEEEEEVEVDVEAQKKVDEPVDHGPCVVIRGFPSASQDTFWMLMDGWDAGYIYECEFPKDTSEDTSVEQEPINAIKLLGCGDTPIQSYTYCNSGEFVLFGMANGVVRIHPVHGKDVLDSLTTHWTLHIHDSQYGAITALRTSFDDKYVFTVGADGNFFVYNFMSDATLKESRPLVQALIPKLQTVVGEDGQEVPKTIDDIDDPNYYSIELEKQKAEHDRMVKIAEEKKQNVRRKIAKLRRSFKTLLSQNESLPDYLRIRPQELEIDPEIRKQQEAKTAEKVDLVHKELEWESEKYSIGLNKLQNRFKSMVECDRIVLYACCTSHKVASFRSSKLPDLYESLRESLHTRERAMAAGKDQKKQSIAGVKSLLPGKRRATQSEVRKKSHQPASGGEVGGKVAKALEKAEQRRRKKELRQAEWDNLYQSKPDENYQDPSDLSAIKEAKDNMGDYKLKTADDYVVPEGQRVNAEIKLQQLLRLLDQIHFHKMHFDEKLLALRDKKIQIIEEVKESVAALKRVQENLDPSQHEPLPTVPKMKREEMPERKLSYDKETLLAFKKQLEMKKDKTEGEDGGGGFGGFGATESKPPPSTTATTRDRSFSNVSVLSGGRPKSHQSVKVADQSAHEAILENVEESLSALEAQLKRREQIRMKYEQDRLLKRIDFLLSNFDGALKTLRHDKSQFEIALKNADLRHVTLFEELILLKEFEKRENTFANRVKIKEDEKLDMEEKVDSCQTKLDIKKEEIDKYMEQEKSLYSTFTSMIGENNKFEGFLTKVFKKKIKRAKKKDESRDGSEEGSDEDDSDEEISSSEESNSDEEMLDDSVCPPGCDQTLYDQVCQLRENRLDIEESLAEEKKAFDTLKKEHEALNKRSKVIDSALTTAESELEAFQREKQQKLNELDVVVTVKLHQIQYIVNNSMPPDLSFCLVFINSDQNRLQKRIKELEVEKAEQKRLFREHRQMHVQLKRDKKGKETEISELEEKVQNMQMLKFGRLVDFDKLENISVNRTAEELKERLRQQEFHNASDLAKWEKKIQCFREKLTLRTRENTGRLNTATLLFQEKQQLEQKLDSRQKSLGAQYSGNRKADLKERHRLVQLVQLQAQEIDALKDEITLLSRKGGHILPPSQPPLPTASQAAITNA